MLITFFTFLYPVRVLKTKYNKEAIDITEYEC